jgi:hypothetical protein
LIISLGFELFTDLCLAHVLCTLNPSLVIIFHCKTIPWFVSDTIPDDFEWTLKELIKRTWIFWISRTGVNLETVDSKWKMDS